MISAGLDYRFTGLYYLACDRLVAIVAKDLRAYAHNSKGIAEQVNKVAEKVSEAVSIVPVKK